MLERQVLSMSFKEIEPRVFKQLIRSFGIPDMMSSKTAKIVPVGICLATLRAYEYGKDIESTVGMLLLDNPSLLQQDMSVWATEAKEVNKPQNKNK